ncbi:MULTISPECIES: hypothetical protein [Psychromonas]|uniref:DUF883 domain-containing protein n=1 Tax=Psychromonas arctica TaxID=168275 RepID=A0ABU9H783_9GAMM|nr:hypothetical protein [Psychromonas sp. SP041]
MATPKAKTQESQQKIEEAYHLAEEATSEAVHSLKNKAQESLSEGSEKVKSVTNQAENIIKERPLLSIGCAFLAGWAVSKLIK